MTPMTIGQAGSQTDAPAQDAGALSVLHISATDNAGGSGRSAYRLHTGLKRLGVQSRMLVGRRVTRDPDIALMRDGWVGTGERWCGQLIDRLDLQYLSYPSSFQVVRQPWFRRADVVQVFNTHGGYFNHLALARMSRHRPLIWRLSDMWAMTGHCAYSYECERWRTGCGSCPHLEEYPRLHRDTSAFLWRVKRRGFARAQMTIVTPSRWLAGLVRQSPLLNRFPLEWIPNGLDTTVFRPRPTAEVRLRFGLPSTGRIVMFSASSVLVERKGATLLVRALARLAETAQDLRLLVVGADAERWRAAIPFPVTTTGHLANDEDIAAAYSAADLFVLPTLADNLPNGLIESLACGTPVVSCDVGGVPEVVRHMDTGYLARAHDDEDLARGMQLLLDDPELHGRMSRRCRDVAEQDYSLELQAQRFRALYRDAVRRRARR